jgi:hypothetical protein
VQLKQPANNTETKDHKACTPHDDGDESEQQTVKNSFSKTR